MTVPLPILIDTDCSFDDFVALLFLLQHPAVEVRAITVVDGVAHIRPAMGNIARLLALAGRADIPFAAGAARPSSAPNVPARWRWLMDYGMRFFLPIRGAKPSPLDAAALIRKTILSSPDPVTIVSLGPMTNLAQAFQADPSLASRINQVVFSGGDFAIPGAVHSDPWADTQEERDFNFYLDPMAVKIVLQSGARISLVPLLVTQDGPSPLLFSKLFVQSLRRKTRTRAARLLARLVYLWQFSMSSAKDTPVWDAVVAALAVHPSLGSWQDARVESLPVPLTKNGLRHEPLSPPVSVRVCTAGDRGAFENYFLSHALGRAVANIPD
jgi:inosine-uridine nucleoside N-ribohydrolase